MLDNEYVYIRVGGVNSGRIILCRARDYDMNEVREVAKNFFPSIFAGRYPSLTTIDWGQLSKRIREQFLVCQKAHNWDHQRYVAVKLDHSNGDSLCRVAGCAN